MFASLISFIKDDRGVTTVEWIVTTGIAVLIVGAAVRALIDKGGQEAAEIESRTDEIFEFLLP